MYHIVPVILRSGTTIEAYIRLHNDNNMPVSERLELIQAFTDLNPHARPPKPGQTVNIPVLPQYVRGKTEEKPQT